MKKSEKNLIPVSNPESISKLMDLALHFHGEKPLSVYPLTVLDQMSDDDESRNLADKLLKNTIKSVKSNNVFIEPIIRSDVNIALAISKVIDELQIDTTIIGWNIENMVGYRVFGTVLDRLLSYTNQQVLVCNTQMSMNKHKRMFLITPAGCFMEPGFKKLIENSIHMASWLGLDITIIGESEEIGSIKEIADQIKNHSKVNQKTVLIWDDALHHIDELIHKDDLLFIVGARKGSISWKNDIHWFPKTIAQLYPSNSLIVAYPRIKNLEFNSYHDPIKI